MAWEPDLLWLIVSVVGGKAADCAAYKVDSERSGFLEIAIEAASDPSAGDDG